jgi:hypothetical protein
MNDEDWNEDADSLDCECSEGCYDEEFDEDYMPDEYAGTYAHDVAGMSDDDIDAALDGEPEAYWNID